MSPATAWPERGHQLPGSVRVQYTRPRSRRGQRTLGVCLDSLFGLSLLSVFFERKLAIVLPQEIQKSFVFALLHVEEPRDDLVIAAGFFQSFADEISHVALRNLPL